MDKPIDKSLLYIRKAMSTRDRLWMYRILSETPEEVTVILNDGTVPSSAVRLSREDFWDLFILSKEKAS